jgi:hypothetical protein
MSKSRFQFLRLRLFGPRALMLEGAVSFAGLLTCILHPIAVSMLMLSRLTSWGQVTVA